MRLAVIPARGGSKRIPGKNIRPFHGKPVIAYAIEGALATGLFDHVIVSTDDSAIASVAAHHGAEVPFTRPAALADDHTGTNDVVRHAVEWYQAAGHRVEQVCCVYATAPFVTSTDLLAAFALLREDIDFVFAATTFDFPVQRALVRDAAGVVHPLFPQWIGHRSQDLQPTLHDAGQFYWGWGRSYITQPVVFNARAVPYELPPWRVQDIDTEADWVRAELLFAAAAAAPITQSA